MWVTEIEFTHHQRLLQILRSRDIASSVKVGNLKGDATLILSDKNLTEKGVLPVDCFKYIYKSFHAPFQCHDPYWFRFHPAVKHLMQQDAIVRIQCIPKSMGRYIAEALIGDDEKNGIKPENISFTNHTHIFQCLYSTEHACFYWGVTSADDPVTHDASWESLRQAVVSSYSEKNLTPVCRAYYKMQEIVEHYFPLWSWTMPPDFNAVDIGASPGGWTQYVAVCMKGSKVLAVDPGDIDADILAIPGVTHCRALAEAPQTAAALSDFGGFSLCVCDINCDAWVAIALLIKDVLPHCGIYSETEQIDPTEQKLFSYLVLTLKLAKNPKEKQINRAVNIVIEAMSTPVPHKLSSASNGIIYGVKGWDFKVVHLNANSRNERTVVCKYSNVPIGRE